MRLFIGLSWAFIWFFVGCADNDVRLASELEDFRVLGIQVAPNAVNLADPIDNLTVELIHYHGDAEEALSFEWTLCLSLGAVSRFECLSESPLATGQSDQAQWSVPVNLRDVNVGEIAFDPTQIEAWRAPSCPDHEVIVCEGQSMCPQGSLCIDGGCRSPTDIFPIELVLRVQPSVGDLRTLPAAVSIPVRAGRLNNQPIKILGIMMGELMAQRASDNTCVSLELPREKEEFALQLEVDESTIEPFEVVAGDVCTLTDEGEVGLISWFASGGELQKPLSDILEPNNTLTLGREDDDLQLFAVVRDGRGTLDYICIDIVRI